MTKGLCVFCSSPATEGSCRHSLVCAKCDQKNLLVCNIYAIIEIVIVFFMVVTFFCAVVYVAFSMLPEMGKNVTALENDLKSAYRVLSALHKNLTITLESLGTYKKILLVK